ncbi:MAG: tyrosine-type recombinase/integrase [Acidimicrobiia bacterium]
MTALAAVSHPDLVEAFEQHNHLLGGNPSYQRQRLGAAMAFCLAHPDLDAWMRRPLESRLNELSRRPLAWQLMAFALLTGRCRPDADFLLAKNFGHSMARWSAALFSDDLARLRDAAPRLGITPESAEALLREDVPLVVAFAGRPPSQLTADDLDRLWRAVQDSPWLTASMRRRRTSRVFGLRRLLFEARIIDLPPVHRRQGGPATREARLAAVATPELRRTILAYLEARSAVLRPATLEKLTSALAIFGEFVSGRFPEVTSVSRLERPHVEAFLTWTATRPSRRAQDGDRLVGPFVTAHAAITLRGFLDDIAAWGWRDAPLRRLVFAADIPRQPDSLPRALPPGTDSALLAAIAQLDDLFARVGLTVLRHTGLRIGELLDLELDCVVDYGAAGSWLRVPLGKLNNERSIPLDPAALSALDEWFVQRNRQRPQPHTRDGHLADFVFVERGRRLGPARITKGLRQAVRAAGLTGSDGEPLQVVAHQLRHTYATTLVNAGMSLQALMTLLGHRSPEMTIRYARLASPTLRAAYEQAIGKMAKRIPLAQPGPPPVPDAVEWLAAEMLKTRVAHGYCSRDLAADACTYANICETCPNFQTAPEFAPTLRAQLADIHQLRQDADERGWTSESARHQRVIDSLQTHLNRLTKKGPGSPPLLDSTPRAG